MLLLSMSMSGPLSYLLVKKNNSVSFISLYILPVIFGVTILIILKFRYNLILPLSLSIFTCLVLENYSNKLRIKKKYLIASFIRDHLFKTSIALIFFLFENTNIQITFFLACIITLTPILKNISFKVSFFFENLKSFFENLIFYLNTYWITIIFLILLNTELNIFFTILIERLLRVISVLISQYSLVKQNMPTNDRFIKVFKIISLVSVILGFVYQFCYNNIESEFITTLITLTISSCLYSLIGFRLSGTYHILRFITILVLLISYIIDVSFVINMILILSILTLDYMYSSLYMIKTFSHDKLNNK